MKNYNLPLNPALLGTFIAVAETGKIGTAAKVLGLSQPAVTAQIRKLEEELKAECFERSVQGMALTASGKELLKYARQIVALLQEAAASATPEALPRGPLRIAASTTIGNHLLPSVLAQFAKDYPEVQIRMTVASTKDVIEAIHRKDSDIGLVEGYSRVAQVRLEKLVDDEILMVVHPDLKSRLRSLSDLQRIPLIWRENGSGTRSVVEKELRRHFSRQELSIKYEFGSTEAIKQAVLKKVGVGFLSRWSIESELQAGKLVVVTIPEIRIERSFSWVLPSEGLNKVGEQFKVMTSNLLRR